MVFTSSNDLCNAREQRYEGTLSSQSPSAFGSRFSVEGWRYLSIDPIVWCLSSSPERRLECLVDGVEFIGIVPVMCIYFVETLTLQRPYLLTPSKDDYRLLASRVEVESLDSESRLTCDGSEARTQSVRCVRAE